MSLGGVEVCSDHLLDHFIDRDLGSPSESVFCLAGIAQQGLDFSRSEIARVNANQHLPSSQCRCATAFQRLHNANFVKPRPLELQSNAKSLGTPRDELTHADLLPSRNDEVIRLLLL